MIKFAKLQKLFIYEHHRVCFLIFLFCILFSDKNLIFAKNIQRYADHSANQRYLSTKGFPSG